MQDEDKEAKVPLTTVRLRVRETRGARTVRMKIKQEDRALGADLRKRDYKDAEYRSDLIDRNAKIEASEDRRLHSLQSEKRDRLLEKKKLKEDRKKERDLRRLTAQRHRCANDEFWVDTYTKRDGTLVRGHCAKLQPETSAAATHLARSDRRE